MTTYRDILRAMKIGEVKKFPREERKRWLSAAIGLYGKGYTFIVSCKKENDFVTVTRLE